MFLEIVLSVEIAALVMAKGPWVEAFFWAIFNP
jgi:hypothetical protein